VILVAIVAGYQYLRPPTWMKEKIGKKKWSTVLVVSVTTSLVYSLFFVPFVLSDEHLLNYAAFTLAGASATFLLIQTSYTDYLHRVADRRALNFLTLMNLPLVSWLMIEQQNWFVLIVSAGMILLGVFFYLSYYFMERIGTSDIRMMWFVAVAVIPLIGLNGVVWAALITGVEFIVMAAVVAWIKKTLKASFPAVPMLLFPFWTVLMLTIFVELPLMYGSMAIAGVG